MHFGLLWTCKQHLKPKKIRFKKKNTPVTADSCRHQMEHLWCHSSRSWFMMLHSSSCCDDRRCVVFTVTLDSISTSTPAHTWESHFDLIEYSTLVEILAVVSRGRRCRALSCRQDDSGVKILYSYSKISVYVWTWPHSRDVREDNVSFNRGSHFGLTGACSSLSSASFIK